MNIFIHMIKFRYSELFLGWNKTTKIVMIKTQIIAKKFQKSLIKTLF